MRMSKGMIRNSNALILLTKTFKTKDIKVTIDPMDWAFWI